MAIRTKSANSKLSLPSIQMSSLKSLSKSRFVRNVLVVATGTAGAQAITIAFSPILTRLYGPEAFGLLGTFMAVLAIATPIAALTYPIAIVLPKSDTEAIGLCKLSAGLAFAAAALLGLLILLLGDRLAELFSLQSISGFLLLIPLAMIFSAFHQILLQWLIRKQQFRLTAQVAVVQAFTVNSAKAGIGWFNPLATTLIVLATLGSALHVLLLWLSLRKRSIPRSRSEQGDPVIRQYNVQRLKKLAYRYRDFPLYRAPQIAINALSQGLPVLLLASFFGPVAAGLYSIAKMTLGAPVTLIGQSISTVFYPKFNEAYSNKENSYRLLMKSLGLLAVVGLTPAVVVIFFGPLFFEVVFGSEWAGAGVYAQWMAPWFYCMLITRPVIAAIPVLSMQKFFLIYELAGVPVRAGMLLLGFYIYSSPVVSVALFSLINCFMYLILTVKALTMAR
ncbi:lipopolysaccharide biosynthesis protein [Stutzerimonas balearica]|uniref:lipopolysaccharide biosynthesis protein n=1 Tax=Stutzerimonas balearica TaxID=74829 RepID=UPI0028981313|nr:oligosaccharide flippase family protein [Stutzerimonas balearica]